MKGFFFYEEFGTSQRKRRKESSGTVVAVATDREQRWFDRGKLLIEAIGSVFDRPDSPVCGTAVSSDYLSETCKRVSEAEARQIHPALFRWLDED